MKVILIKQVPKVGNIGDVLNVKDGYGKNFLIARGLAVAATSSNMKNLEKTKEELAKHEEENIKKYRETAAKLKEYQLHLKIKASKEGGVFGSVGANKISESLASAGFDIDKSQVSLEHPIKSLGEHKILIKFGHGIETQMKLIVEAE
jgi:large subunit ribosomal protein L9